MFPCQNLEISGVEGWVEFSRSVFVLWKRIPNLGGQCWLLLPCRFQSVCGLLYVTYMPLWHLLSCELSPFGSCNIISQGFRFPDALQGRFLYSIHVLHWFVFRISSLILKYFKTFRVFQIPGWKSSLESSRWYGDKRRLGGGSVISRQRAKLIHRSCWIRVVWKNRFHSIYVIFTLILFGFESFHIFKSTPCVAYFPL